MKNVFSYLLVMIFTLQSFGLNAANLANLNNLAEHYELHKTEHQNSFLEFFDLHYGNQKEAHEKEHDEHQNLPFQECQHYSHIFLFEVPQVMSLRPTAPLEIVLNNFNYTPKSDLLIETDILQPPKQHTLL